MKDDEEFFWIWKIWRSYMAKLRIRSKASPGGRYRGLREIIWY